MITFGVAFEAVSREVLRTGPMDYDTRLRAANLLHALLRAGYIAGLPGTLDWPQGDLTEWVVATMRHAGPGQPVDVSEQDAEASPWALRQAATALRAVYSGPPIDRAERLHHATLKVAAEELENLADSVVDAEVPSAGELAEYDRDLLEGSG